MNPSLSYLLKGNHHHADPDHQGFDREDEIRAKLVTEGQHPIAAVLTCSDSRACPETLFEVEAGQLFVIRVAGNVLSPEVLASLEYATLQLQVPLILVLGHSQCGAIEMAIETEKLSNEASSPHLEQLLSTIRIHTRNANSISVDEALSLHTSGVVEDIPIKSQIIRNAQNEGKVEVVGGIHDLRSGKVHILEGQKV